MAAETELLKKAGSPIEKLIRKSNLARWLSSKYQVIKSYYQKPKNEADQRKNKDLLKQILLVDYPEVWQKAWRNEEILLKSMRDLSSGAGAKFLLVSVTLLKKQAGNTEEIDYNKTEEIDYNKPEKLLGEISQRNNFPYIALMPIFEERFKKEGLPIFFPCDGHWNEIGHQWAAEAIFEYLKSHPELLSQ